MSLIQLQLQFHNFLKTHSSDFAQQVVGTERFDVATRLNVYAYAYNARLIEALDANFPIMHQLVGDDAFADLGERYLAAYPPTHFSIRWFGQHLAKFLAETPPYSEQIRLIELAQWEWAMTEAFDAANAQPLTLAEMINIPPDDWANLYFRFHPSVRRLNLKTNIPPIWKAVSAEEAIPVSESSSRPTGWLIWRRGITSYYRSLAAAEADALDNAQSGLNFGDICQELCAFVSDDEAPLHAAQFLKTWLTEDLIIGLDIR
ncbi:DNA-binding domain-containing protein [Chitinivorax sp. B]|uniref:HvfC/BufC N-terminal domain-containing protein n=1 Tax=Chitinivorax sp. B TaxID=2502235 RepID=UPI0010F5CA3A|nr:DNA-binding domain-containing protein [Chitinivorax sp. B]